MIQGQFPLWLLFLLLGLFVSAIVFCSTSNDCPPRYHSVSACVCVWTKCVENKDDDDDDDDDYSFL